MAEQTNSSRDEAKAQPTGPEGGHQPPAAHGETRVQSGKAEQAEGQLNPSSPGNTGTTPGTNASLG